MRIASAISIRALPRAAGRLTRSITPSRRVRRWIAGLILTSAALAAAHLLVIRDLSWFAVTRVEVSGLASKDAAQLRRALTTAARAQTTLHVRPGELERVAGAYAVVASVSAEPDFPHTLRIRVVEHRPVALVPGPGGARVPVARDGTVIRAVRLRGALPFVAAGAGGVAGRVTSAQGRAAVRAAAAVPPALLGRVERVVHRRGMGYVGLLRGGPEILLGNPTRLTAKWAAAAAVLADRETRGATYVDVRLPERPAVGGLPPEPSEPDPGEVTTPSGPAPTPVPAPTQPPSAPQPGVSPGAGEQAAPPSAINP